MNPATLALVFALACLGGRASGRPTKYDQRQEGELNVRTDVEDVVFVVVPPQDLVAAGMGLVAATAADLLRKNYGGAAPERWQLRTPPKLGFASVEKSPYKIDLEKTGIQVKKIQHTGDPNRYNFHEGKNPSKAAPEVTVPASTAVPEKTTAAAAAVTETPAEVQPTTENKTVKKDLKPEEGKKTPGERVPAEAKKKPGAAKTKTEHQVSEAPPRVVGEGSEDGLDPTSIFRHEGCGPDAFRNDAGLCIYMKQEVPPK